MEQPLPAADVEGAKWLRARSPLPLVADESLTKASDVPKLAEGFHGINVKLQKSGGIREALRIIETARACGLKVMLGCMVETGLGIAAGAHLAPLVDWVDLDGNLLLAQDPVPRAPGGGRPHPAGRRPGPGRGAPGGPVTPPLIQDPMAVLAVLLAVLAGLYALQRYPAVERFFNVVPLLVFAYFVPTLLSNTGVIPTQSELYRFTRVYLLPASLVLLVLSVDLPAIARLGRNAVGVFLAGTVGIMVGGPLAYLALGWLVPAELGDQAWKGLAALSGSWIGGSANFVAIGQSVGALDSTLSMMVVVDVGVSNVWTAVLLSFAGREKAMDASIGADRRRWTGCARSPRAFKRRPRGPRACRTCCRCWRWRSA